MIHVVFNKSEVELMGEVIKLDDLLAGNILQIRDDFAVGPIAELETEEGWQSRLASWDAVIEGSPYPPDMVGSFDDRETVKDICKELDQNPEEQVWIWMGQNQHDVMGYYWLIPQLKNYQGRIMILYLNNLPFINEKGQIFYPSWLHEIQPREFVKAKKLARPVTLSEFEIDPDEWKRLAIENAPIRVLEGGKKIVGKPETFFDNEIIKNLTKDWQKASRVLSNTLHRMKIKTGDLFLMSRIKSLIADGEIVVMGDFTKSWKDFDLRLPGESEQDLNSEVTEDSNKEV